METASGWATIVLAFITGFYAWHTWKMAKSSETAAQAAKESATASMEAAKATRASVDIARAQLNVSFKLDLLGSGPEIVNTILVINSGATRVFVHDLEVDHIFLGVAFADESFLGRTIDDDQVVESRMDQGRPMFTGDTRHFIFITPITSSNESLIEVTGRVRFSIDGNVDNSDLYDVYGAKNISASMRP